MKIEELDGNRQKILNDSRESIVVLDYRGMPGGREIMLQPGQVVIIQKDSEKKAKEESKPEIKTKKKKIEKKEDKIEKEEIDKVEEKDNIEDTINTYPSY
jgi:hypothetical protein